MSFLSTIEAVFHKAESAEQVVLKDVSSFVDKAAPIVADVETVLKVVAPSDKSGILAAIEKFLTKYEPDVQKVGSVAASLAPLTGSDLFHAAAVAALSLVSPSGAAANLLNLAVELAYNIFKQKQPAAPRRHCHRSTGSGSARAPAARRPPERTSV